MYIPPSQYRSGLYSNNDYKLITGGSYTGPYYEMLKDGTKYTGKTPSFNSIKLVDIDLMDPPPLPLVDDVNDFDEDNASFIAVLDPNLKSYVQSREQPKPFIPSNLSLETIEKEEITRYYTKRNNQYLYMEIDAKTYVDLITRSPYISWDQYDVTSLNWVIKGETENVYNKNKATVLEIESINSGRFPKGKNWGGFSQYFKNNFLQFYQNPPNEFLDPPTTSPQPPTSGNSGDSGGFGY